MASRIDSPVQQDTNVQFVGQSTGALEAMNLLQLVAESRCDTVLILGPTGTGKELAARLVHQWKTGGKGEFVAVNCAALTANLLESELFGHVKGAFTGADRDKPGLLELAGEGCLFLDEISEMPLELQAKLLRVLQERTFRRVGGTQTLHCGATIIASSNRDLLNEAHAGSFRRDLYYRLAVFPVTLPALATPDRREDIPLLAEHFLAEFSHLSGRAIDGLTEQAVAKLMAHDWPGNVRELRNVIQRAIILERGERLTAESLRLEVTGRPAAAAPAAAPAPQPVEDEADTDLHEFSLEAAEKQFILRALRETNWQRTRAAALLGITRATLHAKLKRYKIQPPASAPTSKYGNASCPEYAEACA